MVTKKAVAATPTKDEDVAEKKAVTKAVQAKQAAKADAATGEGEPQPGKVTTYQPGEVSPVVVPEDVDDHGVSSKVAAPGDPTSVKNEWDPEFVGSEPDAPTANVPTEVKAKKGEVTYTAELPNGQSGKARDNWRNNCFAIFRDEHGKIARWREEETETEPGRAVVTLFITPE